MNDLINHTLKEIGIEKLNEMQDASLKANESGRDVILLSPTGSGKTLAFLLPLLKQMKSDQQGVQALVIAPSRELALQIEEVFKSFKSSFRVVCCYGGHSFDLEKRSLQNPPALVVGTPGRLLDHIEQESLNTDTIRFLVLDEFDKALELGFQEEMSDIIRQLPNLKKRMLLSATKAEEIPSFVKIHHPMTLDFLGEKGQEIRLSRYIVRSPEKDKLESLLKLVTKIGNEPTLIFVNYRESVDRVANFLRKKGADCKAFHGGMEQQDREKSLFQFKSGTSYLMVSTDLASRGLDILDVKHVIHYHLPINQEAYTHRNGRTARMHAEGNAYIILHGEEYLPDYLNEEDFADFTLPETPLALKPSQWVTIYIGKGKRDKISKGDIAGFLMKKGLLEKQQVGVIEVQEQCAFVSIPRSEVKAVLKRIQNEKIKGIKTIFEESK
jgi:superfamily II DNA/RNA helicase